MEVKFEINKNGDLERKDKEALIESYRVLFANLYGKDIVDSFLKVMDLKTNELRKRSILKEHSRNYRKAVQALTNLLEEPRLELLLIYNENNTLIGGGRLRKLNDEEVSVPELVFVDLDKDTERLVWSKAILFLESYFENMGYKKMYVEIPFYEGPLLFRARDLGFVEDPEDIRTGKEEETKTYIVNKSLERTKDESNNRSR